MVNFSQARPAARLCWYCGQTVPFPWRITCKEEHALKLLLHLRQEVEWITEQSPYELGPKIEAVWRELRAAARPPERRYGFWRTARPGRCAVRRAVPRRSN